MMNKDKTVAIIGGGVSGLAAGLLLARKGLQVTIYEANEKVGGCCATTEQDGFIFSDGALWLVGLGILDHAFNRLGLDRPALLPMRRIEANMTTRLPNGASVTIHDGLQVSIQRPDGDVDAARFRVELDRLLSRWGPVSRLFLKELIPHPYSAWRLLRKAWRHLPKLRETIASEMNRLFSDPEMRAALSGALLYTGLAPEEMPAGQILGVIAILTEGYYLPQGGLGMLAQTLANAFEEQGGEIALKTRVKRIVVKGDHVRGLEIEERGFVETNVVLSTASGMTTFLSLMDPEDAPVKMLEKARNAPLSANTFFNVQLGLSNKIDVDSQINYALPLMEEQHRFIHPGPADTGIFIYSVPTMTLPELAPPGGSVVEIFAATGQELPAEAWDEERKERMAEVVVEGLSRLHNLDVITSRVRSPRDFQTGLNLYKGKIYGLSPAINPGEHFPHKSPLPGLYLAGQTTHPGYGIMPSIMSGILAAEKMIKS